MLRHAVLMAAAIGGLVATASDASASPSTGMSSISTMRLSGPRIATPRYFNGIVTRMSQGRRTAIGQAIGGKANDGDEARARIRGGHGGDVIFNSANGAR